MTDARGKANRGPSAGPGNRLAILAAARVRFARDGLAVPLSAIAKDAGVGQGSLYRHFPDRLALALAVFEQNLDEVDAVVAEDATSVSDLLDLVERQAMLAPALVDLMWRSHDDARVERLSDRVRVIAEVVVARDREAGLVGAHVEADDVLAAVSMLADLTARAGGHGASVPGLVEQRRRARRLLDAALAPPAAR